MIIKLSGINCLETYLGQMSLKIKAILTQGTSTFYYAFWSITKQNMPVWQKLCQILSLNTSGF